MRWKPHVTVAAVIEEQSRFLLVEENIDGITLFNQPAGHLEPGESLLAAVNREVLEETARPFHAQALVGTYLYQITEKQRSYLRFCFCGEVDETIPGHPLDEEIIATHWMPLEEIQALQSRLRSPMVLQCIEDHLAGSQVPLDSLHFLQS